VTKRILLLRAEEDAARTGERLRGMGFEPLLSPVLEIVATGAAPPTDALDAALATSAKGVALCSFSLALPLHAVGARIGALAAARGWGSGLRAETATALGREVCARYPAPARFLYLAGRDRKKALEAVLRAAGHEVAAIEIYEARAARALRREALAAIAAGGVGAALHYSRRSARIFLDLAGAAGLAEDLRAFPHLALSQDVAEELRREPSLEPRVADAPSEKSLLTLLAASVAP
jgi:uroporphyrinogen-III synthase